MMNQEKPRCKVIPWRAGLDIVIWECPVCGCRFYEYASGLNHEVYCTLCGRLIWPGANDVQIEFSDGRF